MSEKNSHASADSAPHDLRLPFLTAELPGISGTIKKTPDDFDVEEIPAYEPAGAGEHLFLWIEKRDRSAADLVHHVSQTLGIASHQVGTAGLKDRQAVTRQYVSVPAAHTAHVDRLNSDCYRVLASRLHSNKLKTGHLRGNRFSILVRDVAETSDNRLRMIADRVEQLGFPNFYGNQRFGSGGETLKLGFDLLKQRRSRRDLPRRQQKFLTRLALSAAQSWMFNQALAQRLLEGTLHRVLAGDVMQVAASGGCFVADDVDTEQRRFESRETVITGPIFGPKMKRPTGEVASQEAKVQSDQELTGEEFRLFGKLTLGTRRPYLVWPSEFNVVQESDGVRFRFALPSGVYATTLLREFMKSRDE